jgi:SepF-like predicted cell division protein (DUF552 family)
MWARHAFVVAAYYNYCVEFVVLENNADSVRTVVVVVAQVQAAAVVVAVAAVVVDQEVVVVDLADVHQDVLASAAAFAEP